MISFPLRQTLFGSQTYSALCPYQSLCRFVWWVCFAWFHRKLYTKKDCNFLLAFFLLVFDTKFLNFNARNTWYSAAPHWSNYCWIRRSSVRRVPPTTLDSFRGRTGRSAGFCCLCFGNCDTKGFTAGVPGSQLGSSWTASADTDTNQRYDWYAHTRSLCSWCSRNQGSKCIS